MDDGSDDRTAEAARQAHARVLRHLKNRGYGASLKTGIIAAKYNHIAITDADGTYPADQFFAWLAHWRIWSLGWLANLIARSTNSRFEFGSPRISARFAIQYFPVLSNKFSFTSTITMALLADDHQVVYHPINSTLCSPR